MLQTRFHELLNVNHFLSKSPGPSVTSWLEEHVGHYVDSPVAIWRARNNVPPHLGHEEDVSGAQDDAEGPGLLYRQGVIAAELVRVALAGTEVHRAEPVCERGAVGVGALQRCQFNRCEKAQSKTRTKVGPRHLHIICIKTPILSPHF